MYNEICRGLAAAKTDFRLHPFDYRRTSFGHVWAEEYERFGQLPELNCSMRSNRTRVPPATWTVGSRLVTSKSLLKTEIVVLQRTRSQRFAAP